MAIKRRRKALFDEPVYADDVVVRAARLGDALLARLAPFFKSFGLTMQQFNVLRILYVRDEEGKGLSTSAIGPRLTVRAPDITRLIDRLEVAGLVERVRTNDDRRVVRVRLTSAGFALVEEIHDPLIQNNENLFAKMSTRDLQVLARLLGRAYEALPEPHPQPQQQKEKPHGKRRRSPQRR